MSVKLSTPARTAILESGIKTVFDYSVIEIRSGSPAATADMPLTGTVLAYATTNGGAFTPGATTNGLRLDTAVSGAISKVGNWIIVPVAAGVAGHFVWKTNAADDNSANNGKARITGTVGTSGADMQVANVNIALGSNGTIDTFTVNLPTL